MEKFSAEKWMADLLAATDRAEEKAVNERPSAEQAKAVADNDQTVVLEANAQLERDVAAENAVYVVMRQRGLENPTLLSKWTMNEIARLLHALYADPASGIVLGGQHLGAGFVRQETFEEGSKATVRALTAGHIQSTSTE